MSDERPALTKEEVQAEASDTLTALRANRGQWQNFQDNWRKLWQLAREARAAALPIGKVDGPWYVDYEVSPLSPLLTADGFKIPIWPAADGRAELDLAKILNWAGVPVPMAERRSSDDKEAAREAAERRREQAELHRRQSEEGRDIAETIRTRHEGFREDQEVSREGSEQMRDAQEASRELAEQAREVAEELRRTAEEARSVLDETRQAMTELKDLAQRQRTVLDRQEKALAAFEARIPKSSR